MYINDKLEIDLGGVHGPESATVNLDTLVLTVGNTYDFDFFFAERHTVGSDLTVTTSIELNPNPAAPEPATWALAPTGFFGLAWVRRLRLRRVSLR